MCTFITIYIAIFILYLSLSRTLCQLLLIRQPLEKHGDDRLRTSGGHEDYLKDRLSTSHKQSLSESVSKCPTKSETLSAAIYRFIKILFNHLLH